MFKQGLNSEGELIRDWYVEHEAVDVYCPPEEGMTRQEFKDECDINVLLANYEKTGRIDHFNMREPQYLDVSDVPDLPQAIAVMDAAERAFMTLPASVRKEFDNDPVKFVEFAQDGANLDKMREWGLAPPAPPPADLAEPASAAPATPKGSSTPKGSKSAPEAS